jgi:drug/metabolite transporter (DMT)-like permease
VDEVKKQTRENQIRDIYDYKWDVIFGRQITSRKYRIGFSIVLTVVAAAVSLAFGLITYSKITQTQIEFTWLYFLICTPLVASVSYALLTLQSRSSSNLGRLLKGLVFIVLINSFTFGYYMVVALEKSNGQGLVSKLIGLLSLTVFNTFVCLQRSNKSFDKKDRLFGW